MASVDECSGRGRWIEATSVCTGRVCASCPSVQQVHVQVVGSWMLAKGARVSIDSAPQRVAHREVHAHRSKGFKSVTFRATFFCLLYLC